MPDNNLTVENNNSNNIEERFLTDTDFQKIPSIFFDSMSGILDTLGSNQELAEKGAKFIAKVGFVAGTSIDLTINFLKDKDSNDFYIALSTVGKNAIKYKIGNIIFKRAVITAISAGAASLLGLSTAPVWLSIATAVGVVVTTTLVADALLDFAEKKLLQVADYAGKKLELYAPDFYATITSDSYLAECYSDNYPESKFMDNKATMTSNMY